ncbi:MAG: hypothetical protein JOY58_01830 [Solirubrobacterales bacterium]|nr:hypothetical protein [Solirubrobacterales bacterium]
MVWVESTSPSFRARHDSADADDAERLLLSLERARERLGRAFPRVVVDLTVVFHGSMASLSLANPAVPLAWLLSAPAARRYIAGWSGQTELHVLAPAALRRRASSVPGSRQMLALSAAALYARRVIVENNRQLRAANPAARVALALRWAWLIEGSAGWFSGQTEQSRPAVARRLREATRPAFPPGVRDAPLLGGTVIDLLVREEGELAAAQLASRLHPAGARAALSMAFGGRELARTEDAWRSHLARLASGA